MKRIMLSIAAVAMIMVSCEKEDPTPPSIDNQTEVPQKNKIQKSGIDSDSYWAGIGDFIDDILTDGYESEMQAEKAMYFTETTLDWRLTGDEENVVERRELDSISTSITAYENEDGDLVLSGSQLTDLNDEIYDDIAGIASELATSSGQDVLVDIVDLEWDINFSSGVISIDVKTMFGLINNSLVNPTSCVVEEAKATYAQRCNGNSYVRDAADEIDFYLRPLCGTWNNSVSCNMSNSIVTNPVTVQYNATTPCGNYVDGAIPFGTCRTAIQNQSDFDDTRDVWNNQCLGGLSNKIRTAGYIGDDRNIPSQKTYHTAVLSTVDRCIQLCNIPFGCPADNRPVPIF